MSDGPDIRGGRAAWERLVAEHRRFRERIDLLEDDLAHVAFTLAAALPHDGGNERTVKAEDAYEMLKALVKERDRLRGERDHYSRFATMVGEIVRLLVDDIPSIDVETLLRDLPANLAAVKAERDRLRGELNGANEGAIYMKFAHDSILGDLKEAEREQDRLRVENARFLDRLADHTKAGLEWDRLLVVVREWQEAHAAYTGGHAEGERVIAAGKALATLDVSGEATDD